MGTTKRIQATLVYYFFFFNSVFAVIMFHISGLRARLLYKYIFNLINTNLSDTAAARPKVKKNTARGLYQMIINEKVLV